MYIYDADNEVANRTVSQPGVRLDSDLIASLQEELDDFNAHVQMFRNFNISEQDPRDQIVLFSDTSMRSLLIPYTCQTCVAVVAS